MNTHQINHDSWTQFMAKSGLGRRIEGRRPTALDGMDGLEARFITGQIVAPHMDEEDGEGWGAAHDDLGASMVLLDPLGAVINLGVECNVTDEVKDLLGVDIETDEEDALLGNVMRPILTAMLRDPSDLEVVDALNERFADLCQRARDHRTRFGDQPRTELTVALAEVLGLRGEDVDRYVDLVCEDAGVGDLYNPQLAESLAEILQDARQLALDVLAFRPQGYSDAYVACVAASDYGVYDCDDIGAANLFLHDEQLSRESDQARGEAGEWPAPRADGLVKRLVHSDHYFVLANHKYAGRTSKGTQLGLWSRITASDPRQAQLIDELAHYAVI